MTVEHFNQWYGAMDGQGQRDRLWQELLDLPPELVSTSLLSLSGLREVVAPLDLAPGRVLLDLACGRGGYGLWLARETGCRLIGVDFSEVAVVDAQQRIAEFGVTDRAEFRVGDLEATGLPDASVDAVMCLDAIQFAGNPTSAAAEACRVLRPGGVAVFTSWQAQDPADDALPPRIRDLDLASALPAGGLVGVSVTDKPEWLDTEWRLWNAVMAADPDGDETIQDLQDEGVFVTQTLLPRARRVLATGRAPA